MSVLPAGVYTSHAMSVAGVNVVTPDTGDQYGWDIPVFSRVVIADYPVMYEFTTVHTPSLPAASYTSYAMAVAGGNVVLPASGDQYGNRYPHLYVVLTDGVLVTQAASTVGRVTVVFSVSPPQAAQVVGVVTLTVGSVIGGVVLSGVASCIGEVRGTFAPAITNSAAVVGEVKATFETQLGQAIECISGDGVVVGPSSSPSNAVH